MIGLNRKDGLGQRMYRYW